MLDELLLGGEVQETSKKNVLKAIAAQDLLQEVSWKTQTPKPVLPPNPQNRIITANKVYFISYIFIFFVKHLCATQNPSNTPIASNKG